MPAEMQILVWFNMLQKAIQNHLYLPSLLPVQLTWDVILHLETCQQLRLQLKMQVR